MQSGEENLKHTIAQDNSVLILLESTEFQVIMENKKGVQCCKGLIKIMVENVNCVL